MACMVDDFGMPTTPSTWEGLLHSADSLAVAQQRAVKLKWTLVRFSVFADFGDETVE